MACGDDRDILREMYPTYGYSPAPDCEDLVTSATYVNPGDLPYADLACSHYHEGTGQPLPEPHDAQWDDTVSGVFQQIQNQHATDINVTSVFRCPMKNDSIRNASPNSRHVFGNAFDFDNGDAAENWAVAISAAQVVSDTQILLYPGVGEGTYRSLRWLTDRGYNASNLPEYPDVETNWTTYRKGHVSTG